MKTLEREIQLIYKNIPELKCKKLCQHSCQSIPMTELEWNRIIKQLGKSPGPTEQILVPDGSGNTSLKISCLSCPMLKNNLCSVYDIRPMICRLWGTTKRMRCPHGCTPKRWLSNKGAFELLNRMQNLDLKYKIVESYNKCNNL